MTSKHLIGETKRETTKGIGVGNTDEDRTAESSGLISVSWAVLLLEKLFKPGTSFVEKMKR